MNCEDFCACLTNIYTMLLLNVIALCIVFVYIYVGLPRNLYGLIGVYFVFVAILDVHVIYKWMTSDTTHAVYDSVGGEL